MAKPSLIKRARYAFDNMMGRGPIALVALLGILIAVFVLINTAVVLWLNAGPDGTGGERKVTEVLWSNLIRTLDADDVAPGAVWPFRLVMLIITIVGLFIGATLIGIVATAFNSKVDSLRQGRSSVIESGHTVILGWDPKVPALVQSLVDANASKEKATVVILANLDRVVMDDALRARVPDPGSTRIVCRSGDLLDQDDLLRASPFDARAVILLGDPSSEDADDRALKTALALSQHPERAGRPLHLIGHLQHAENLDAANLAADGTAVWILDAEKVGQIIAQASQQPGLSGVYTDLLNFGGTELYITDQPSLHGRTFREVQAAFATTIAAGWVRDGVPLLNPAPDAVFEPGDQLVVLAEDDSTIVLGTAPEPDPAGLSVDPAAVPGPDATLILGSNSSLDCLLREMDGYAAPHSTVTVASEFAVAALGPYANLEVTVLQTGPVRKGVIETLDPAGFQHAIVLAYRDNLPAQSADTRTLVTLLHLRDAVKRTGTRLNVVSEMLDDRNRKLAEVTQIDDFIVSDHLVSQMMAQVAENPGLAAVFGELFSSAGAEIYLRPAPWYVATDSTPVSFATVMEAARQRGETGIGYLESGPDGRPLSVRLNPDLATARAYSPADRVVVIGTR